MKDEDLLLTEEDERETEEQRRDRMHMLSSLGSFASVVVGVAVILLVSAILFSLIRWLKNDIGDTLTVFLSWL